LPVDGLADHCGAVQETAPMPKKPKGKRPVKSMLRLPDLDHSKTSVLQSLGSVASKRTTLSLSMTSSLGTAPNPDWRSVARSFFDTAMSWKPGGLASAPINLRLAAVRRLAYEAADNGLLCPDLAASVRRVKGAKKLGTRLGNWLTCARGRRLFDAPDRAETKGKRDQPFWPSCWAAACAVPK
jgi:hypothetical protein